MAKIRIPVEQLPPPNKYGDHNIQFRVVSEDRNRVSAWSTVNTIKSLGQYRPLQSNVEDNYISGIGQEVISITWDTPTIYNYSPLLSSASIAHNHSANWKQHLTDIYIRWTGGTASGHYEYHDRVSTDTTTIIKPVALSPTHVYVIGTVATYGLPPGISGVDLDNYVASLEPLYIFEYDRAF